MAPTRSLSLVALAGSALLLGCSSGPELSAPVETMVELEATWQCEVTRFAFEDSADIEARSDELRARYDVSADDYAIFTTMLHEDVGLRESVADQIDQQCLSTDDVTGES